MGPVAQLVFKTSAVVQPTARSVRLRRRSASNHAPESASQRQYVCPRSPSENGPPPVVTAFFHGKHPWF